MNAACSSSVNVYESFPGKAGSWGLVCGTSEATPLFAGIVALADQVAGHSLGLINPALYTMESLHAAGLVDVTVGNNTVSFTQNGHQHTVQGFGAGPGYDLASGTGTVDAANFVPELAGIAGYLSRP
jgi:subtilase family serine protease